MSPNRQTAITIFSAAMAAAMAFDAGAAARPYEFTDAGRTEDAHPAIVDFEKPCEWKVRCWDAEATFERTQEQQLFGDWTGKLTYRATGKKPRVSIRLAEGIPMPQDEFDTMSVWIRGEHFTRGANTSVGESTPKLTAVFRRPDGSALCYHLADVTWKSWFLRYVRFPAQDIPKLRESTFVGFELTGFKKPENRVLYFDVSIGDFRLVPFQRFVVSRQENPVRQRTPRKVE